MGSPTFLGSILRANWCGSSLWERTIDDMQTPIPRPAHAHDRRWSKACFSGLFALSLSGCSTQGGGPLDKALEAVGLKTPPVVEQLPKELPLLPRKLALRLHAGEQLNTDTTGRSLAVVARVYKLRSTDAFMQAPYDTFAASNPDRNEAWNRDVVEVREVVLAPGQRHEVIETIAPGTSHLAVVAMFRSPAEQRWRFVFDAKAATANGANGITVGLHACAMSVAEGPVIDAALETQRLAGVRCAK
jgi:type VI secretion system protein VasD